MSKEVPISYILDKENKEPFFPVTHTEAITGLKKMIDPIVSDLNKMKDKYKQLEEENENLKKEIKNLKDKK